MDLNTKSDLVRAFIRDNPGATIRETVKATQVSRALVSMVRAQERARTGEDSRPGSRNDQEGPVLASHEDILARVLGGTALKLTAAQQAQLFSELAISPKLHPRDRAVMLNGLRALEAASASTDQLGPRPPLTSEDKIHRLSLLLSACGPDLAGQAWDVAFPSEPSCSNTSESTPSPVQS